MHARLCALAAVALATHTGCSSTSATTQAEAGWNLHLSAGPSGTCSLSGLSVAFGTVTDETATLVTTEIGANTSQFTTCIVNSDTPGMFSVSATTEEGNPSGTAFSVSVPNISPDATQASPAAGAVSFVGPASDQTLVSGNCDFYFKNPSAGTEGVGEREVWCAYACPSIIIGDGGTSDVCEVTESYIAYRSCALGVVL